MGCLGASAANASNPEFAFVRGGRTTVVWQRDPTYGISNGDFIAGSVA